MGAKERSLGNLLERRIKGAATPLQRPSIADVVASRYAYSVIDMYEALGGVLDRFPLNLRCWDMEFEGLAVELDEQLHFNRFRAATLRSDIYAELPSFPLEAYRSYCVEHEAACVRAGRHGGKWTSASSEKQFGPSPARGELSGSGPARWRQRAFYDFVKDISPLIVDVPVARIAIWDKVEEGGQSRTIGEVLTRPSPLSASAIMALIDARTP